MKIRDLFEAPKTLQLPGGMAGPMGPGTRQTGDIQTPNTDPNPNTSNTPKTSQPTGFAPSTQTPSAPGVSNSAMPPSNNPADVRNTVGQQMGAETAEQDHHVSGTPESPVPVAPGQATQAQQQPATAQQTTDQLTAIIRRLAGLSQQEPIPPATQVPEPGVSGDTTNKALQPGQLKSGVNIG
jgi:hypothetical protein